MTSGEASRKGIDLVIASPALMISELVWRWAFAVGAIGIILSYASILRDAISLSAADQNVLFSGDLMQMLTVATRMSITALPLFAQAAIGAFPKIALVWWLCITLGRSPMLRRMVSISGAVPAKADRRFWVAMIEVHGVRVLLLLILVSAYLAASMASQRVLGTDIDHLRIFPAILIFLLIFSAGAVLYLWTNFIASLASIYVAKGRGALDALADAVRCAKREWSMLGGIAAANATVRTVAAMVISGASVLLLPMSRYLPAWVIAAFAVLLTMVYCAVSDVLLVGRAMAYALAINRDPAALPPKGSGPGESALYSAPSDLRS